MSNCGKSCRTLVQNSSYVCLAPRLPDLLPFTYNTLLLICQFFYNSCLNSTLFQDSKFVLNCHKKQYFSHRKKHASRKVSATRPDEVNEIFPFT
jgi:hypothetical protein